MSRRLRETGGTRGPDYAARFAELAASGSTSTARFLAPGTEPEVVRRLSAPLRPGGLLVSRWRTDRLAEPRYGSWTAAAGLEPVARHPTWSGSPWHDGADWCVAVDRRTS